MYNILLQEDFGGEGVDLYDDVIAAPPGGGGDGNSISRNDSNSNNDSGSASNHSGSFHMGNNINNHGGRFRLYIGNLTWVSLKRPVTVDICGGSCLLPSTVEK